MVTVMRTGKIKKVSSRAIAYLCTIGMAVYCLFPVYWMLITSLKSNKEIYSLVPTFWPKNIVFDGYIKLFGKLDFAQNILNSLFVSLVVSFVSVFVSMLAAYAIARVKFNGRTTISRGILYAYLMPQSLLFIPLYLLVSRLGLNNSLWGLILIYPTITIPYATWMLISYFKSIPVSLEEAAIMDGCSRWGAMFRICFPLSMPGIVSTLVFAFTLSWNEYLYALVIINDSAIKTIPLALSDMVVADIYAWGPLMGGSIVSSIPIIVLYLLCNRHLISGMTAGGVKT